MLAQVMNDLVAWGNKPLPEPMLFKLIDISLLH